MSTRSRTWTSSPRCLPTSAASRPIGPAPVTSTVCGSQKARLADCTRPAPTPSRRPSWARAARRGARGDGSTFMAYSGSIRQRSDMKPSICLMPRSVYWPLRHMSHSPTAQLGQGTGSGRRTMPDDQVALLESAARARVDDAAERFVAEHEARLAAAAPSRTCPRRSRRPCRRRRRRWLRRGPSRRGRRARERPPGARSPACAVRR